MDLDRTIAGVLGRFKPKWVVACYLSAQAAAIIGWWLLLVAAPETRVWFFPEPLTGAPLMSFWLADLGLLAGGSLLTAWLVVLQNRSATPAAWFLAGAFYYPAIYCLVVSHQYGGGELGVAAMFTAGGLTLAMATVIGGVGDHAAGFRECDDTLIWAGIKTFLQIVVFWGTFLYVLPYTIVALQHELGIALFDFSGQLVIGWLVFAIFGALGIGSSLYTLSLGRGTPLPTDCASVLVVTGPYKYVRNPMALAGIGQGVAAGVLWGSWPVMLYALCGVIAWHFGARPLEEVDLAKRFGEPYERYRLAVRCWVPHLRAYDP